jgi:hypothetical protein
MTRHRIADCGSWLPELGRSRYRPSSSRRAVFCRRDGRRVAILHVIRAERVLDVRRLEATLDDGSGCPHLAAGAGQRALYSRPLRLPPGANFAE